MVYNLVLFNGLVQGKILTGNHGFSYDHMWVSSRFSLKHNALSNVVPSDQHLYYIPVGDDNDDRNLTHKQN